MVFKNKHKKEEAKDLVFALRHSSVYYYGDVAENIFSQIRSEIEDCEWRRSHFWNSAREWDSPVYLPHREW